jgi:RNA polymerase sigma-32 factor
MLVDPAPDAEAILVGHEESVLQKKALYEAINVLTGRERQVFEARRLALKPPTLDELAHEFSISAERVRQIEVEAFAKVKRAAHDRIGAVSFGRQLAKSYLPRPSAAAATPLPRTSYGAPSL